MQKIILAILASSILAQNIDQVNDSVLDDSSNIRENMVSDFNQKMNDGVMADYQANLKKYNDFLDQAEREIEANSGDTEIKNVGKFDIRVQKNCEYDIPEIP